MNQYPNQYVECDQSSGVLKFTHVNCYESRGTSVEKMIRDCVSKFNVTKDFAFVVNTDDIPRGNLTDLPLYHFCNNHNYHNLFPDFFYESWPEIKVDNYSLETQTMRSLYEEAITDKVGWIGTLLCDKRQEVYNIYGRDNRFEIIPITWVRQVDGTLITDKYMSYYEQYKRWKYLLDIEGGGWSARLKTLLTIPRVTFVIDREWKDWCWNFIKPWEHYIPVKRDLSDFDKNYVEVINNKELQTKIIENNKQLYDVCLSYDSAISQIYKLIQQNK